MRFGPSLAEIPFEASFVVRVAVAAKKHRLPNVDIFAPVKVDAFGGRRWRNFVQFEQWSYVANLGGSSLARRSRFGVWGLGFWVWCLWFGVSGLGFEV